jgi:glyoxylase-like metal-dependent hydrolase (beta-lactamase superfamily II)
MKTWVTRTGTRVTELVHGRCNCYLVSGRGASLLVDTGRAKSWSKLSSSLDRAGVGKHEPLLVVLTHTHFDHAENAARLKAEYDATILVHQSEAGFLRTGDSPLPAGTLPFTRVLMRLFGSWEQRRVRYAPVEPDILIQERYDLRAHGLDGSLIHTPGHSAGSMSVVLGNELALVGDAMVGLLPGAVFPPYADDPRQVLTSWQALLDTGCAVFLPAHGSERQRAVVAASLNRRRSPREA